MYYIYRTRYKTFMNIMFLVFFLQPFSIFSRTAGAVSSLELIKNSSMFVNIFGLTFSPYTRKKHSSCYFLIPNWRMILTSKFFVITITMRKIIPILLPRYFVSLKNLKFLPLDFLGYISTKTSLLNFISISSEQKYLDLFTR